MRLNLDLSKVDDSYTREIFRQILDVVGSTRFVNFIHESILSRQIKGEIVTSKAGVAEVSLLKFKPFKDSESVYVDGLRKAKGVGKDYTINYSTGLITFEYTLAGTELVMVDYVK